MIVVRSKARTWLRPEETSAVGRSRLGAEPTETSRKLGLLLGINNVRLEWPVCVGMLMMGRAWPTVPAAASYG